MKHALWPPTRLPACRACCLSPHHHFIFRPRVSHHWASHPARGASEVLPDYSWFPSECACWASCWGPEMWASFSPPPSTSFLQARAQQLFPPPASDALGLWTDLPVHAWALPMLPPPLSWESDLSYSKNGGSWWLVSTHCGQAAPKSFPWTVPGELPARSVCVMLREGEIDRRRRGEWPLGSHMPMWHLRSQDQDDGSWMGPGLCQPTGQGCAYRGVPCRNSSRGMWKDQREESDLRFKTLDSLFWVQILATSLL